MGIFGMGKAKASNQSQVDAFEVVAAQVVDVLATAGVVLDERNLVLRASPGAVQFGLVQNGHLIHASLLNLVEQSRLSNIPIEVELQIDSGLQREQLWVNARAAKFGERYVMLLVEDQTEAKKLRLLRKCPPWSNDSNLGHGHCVSLIWQIIDCLAFLALSF